MNSLLPKIIELEKIVDSRETFSDSPMSKDFILLSEKDQLQVLVDIVRQSMIYSKYPNPDNDTKYLIGDDFTSSKVFMNYISDLGLFTSCQLVICGSRKDIDIDDYNTSHFAVVVKGLNNRNYLVDTTPDIGYGYGQVNRISIYKNLVIVDDKLDNFINLIRKSMYEINNGLNEIVQIEIFKEYKNYFYQNYFNGLLLKYGECIYNSNFIKLQALFNRELGSRFNDLKILNQKNNEYKKKILLKWYDQLNFLLEYSKDNKTQQEIAQRIVGERENSLKIDIFGKKIKLSNLTPRLFWENDCNVVLIKPSSYLAGVSASAIEYMIPDRRRIITSYNVNLGERSELGLNPMSYFHPHGIKYQKQMLGLSKVILVKDNSKILNVRKHFIRDNYTQIINGKYVNWFDNSKVLWDTDLNTNLVHSTDDAVETSIHFLAGFPEYQLFTRYNYPNPKLRKEKKK